MFDLNQLLASHQTARFNTDRAASPIERQTWQHMVDFYAERINHFRAELDIPAYQW